MGSHSRPWPILNCLRDMGRSEHLTPGQVGNRAGQFERAMEGAGTQVQLLDSCLDQRLGGRLDRAVLPHFLRSHFGVAGQASTGEAPRLDGACRLDPLPDGGR